MAINRNALGDVFVAAGNSIIGRTQLRGSQSLLDALEGNLKGWAEVKLFDRGPSPNSHVHNFVIRAVRNDGVHFGVNITITDLEMLRAGGSASDMTQIFRMKLEQALMSLERLRRCSCRMDPERGLVHCDEHPDLSRPASE